MDLNYWKRSNKGETQLHLKEELKKYEIYEITVIHEVMDRIEEKSEQISHWKTELHKIINSFDEVGFKKFLES